MARLFDAVSGSHPAAKSRSPYSVFRIIRGVYVCMYSYTQPYTPVPTQASQPTLVRSLSSALYQRCASLHPHKHVDKQRLGIILFLCPVPQAGIKPFRSRLFLRRTRRQANRVELTGSVSIYRSNWSSGHAIWKASFASLC